MSMATHLGENLVLHLDNLMVTQRENRSGCQSRLEMHLCWEMHSGGKIHSAICCEMHLADEIMYWMVSCWGGYWEIHSEKYWELHS